MNTPSEPLVVDLSQAVPPGFWRRLLAIIYDIPLVLTSIFLSAIPVVMFYGGGPLNEPWQILSFQFFMVSVVFVYFGWQWQSGGQTLAMRTWRLLLLRTDGRRVTWFDCAKRFVAAVVCLAPAGLGLLWLVVDREHLALHDRLSGTRLVLLARA